MKCKDCSYYDQNDGRCRINPPVLHDSFLTGKMWPAVQKDDWCGKHESLGLQYISKTNTETATQPEIDFCDSCGTAIGVI